MQPVPLHTYSIISANPQPQGFGPTLCSIRSIAEARLPHIWNVSFLSIFLALHPATRCRIPPFLQYTSPEYFDLGPPKSCKGHRLMTRKLALGISKSSKPYITASQSCTRAQRSWSELRIGAGSDLPLSGWGSIPPLSQPLGTLHSRITRHEPSNRSLRWELSPVCCSALESCHRPTNSECRRTSNPKYLGADPGSGQRRPLACVDARKDNRPRTHGCSLRARACRSSKCSAASGTLSNDGKCPIRSESTLLRWRSPRWLQRLCIRWP